MNIKKIIKYTLILIIALFLAKCSLDVAMYRADLAPEVNPNPIHKMRVHGNFPFEDEVKLDMGILFITTNPICDKKNWLAGIRFPHRFMKAFPATVKDGAFESDIYLDSYFSGFCKWQAYGVYILPKKNLIISNTNENEKHSSKKISTTDTYIGVIAYEAFQEQGKTLDVECIKRHEVLWKGLPREEMFTRYHCKYLGKISRAIPDSGSKIKPNISSLQKKVEINFINKGFKEWEQ